MRIFFSPTAAPVPAYLARLTPDIIDAKGRADIDGLAAFLGDKPFLLGQQPSTADTAVFGLLAPMVYWPMQTPVASYAKSVANYKLCALDCHPRSQKLRHLARSQKVCFGS
jgi:glutathione S-transferase